jgi:anti-sigma factor RsiW
MEHKENNEKLSAYLDGEVRVEERAEIEKHVAQCAECAELLAELRGVSAAVANMKLPGDATAMLRRVHERVDVKARRRLEHLAEGLMALAACLAVMAVIRLQQPAAEVTAPAPWEQAALQATDDSSSSNGRDIALAQWQVADLSGQGAGHE